MKTLHSEAGTSKPTVLWMCPHLTPYHSFLFRSLDESGCVNLEVWYAARAKETHPWKNPERCESYTRRFGSETAGIDWRLLREVLRARYDLVVVGAWSVPTYFVALTMLALWSKAYVVFSDTPRESGDRVWAREQLRSLWLRWILSRARSVLVTGDVGVRRIRQFTKGDCSVLNFPFWVDLEEFAPPERERVGTAALEVLSIGQLTARKGYDLAIRAIGRLVRRGYGGRLRYRIAGAGPAERDLRNLVCDLGLEREVVFLGWLDHTELPDLLASADIFVHPAYWDPFPNSVLEAMACGVPVLGTSASGSVVDRVTSGTNGFVVEPGDIEALTGCLEALLRCPPRARSMGEKARETALEWPVAKGVRIICGLASDLGLNN